MKLTIIGCCGTFPSKEGATSAYLIEDKGTKVLLDCGSGSISRLQKHINLYDLDAVVISHYHSDHYADFECMQFAAMVHMKKGLRKESLLIYGPGEEQKLTYKNYTTGKTYKNKDYFKIGTLKFTTNINKHGIEAYSIRVENEEHKSIVYTGDTAYYEKLSQFARDADVIIADGSLYEDEKLPGHMTAREAGKVAADGNIKSLIISHLPHHGDTNELVKEAKKVYNNEVILARHDLVLKI